MIKRYVQQWLYRRVAGVHLHRTAEGEQLNMVLCQRTGSALDIVRRWPNVADWASIKTLLPDYTPLVVTITGQGVLEGAVSTTTDWAALLHQRLPGADPRQFVGQFNASSSYLSIIRTEVLAQVLETVTNAALPLVDYQIGAAGITTVIPLLPKQDTLLLPPYEVLTSTTPFTIHNSTTEVVESSVPIGKQALPSTLLLALSGALAQVTQQLPTTYGIPDTWPAYRQNFEIDTQTRLVGIGGLSVIFLALLINFLVFNSSNQGHNEVEAELQYAQQYLGRIDSLQAQLANRSAITDGRPLRQSQKSRYVDEIAATLPTTIRLEKMTLAPLQQKNTNDYTQRRIYEEQTLTISAQTADNGAISLWIRQLEQLAWIQEVQLAPYRQTSEHRSNGTFTLIITLAK